MFVKMFDWEDVIVKTENGHLQGKLELNSDGVPFYAFKGIRYAKPPIGDLRFQDPLPPEKWTGLREAFEFGSISLQYSLVKHKFDGSEDCLYLNVYTRCVDNVKDLKPVMVWIHGGGYVANSGDNLHCGPEYFMRKDIVLVTLNYRLGVFGFLNLEDEVAPGNQGLKDQFMALKWVKANIENFGGDPNNVTIFGESAGAVSVHYLTLSPMAKGLFHKAICQSGTAFNCFARLDNPKQYVYQLCNVLGKDLKDPKEIFEFLKTVESEKLVEAQQRVRIYTKTLITSFIFGPGVDHKSSNPFMPIPVEEAAEHAAIHVPLMLGYTNREGISYMLGFNKDIFDYIDKNLDKVLNPRTKDIILKRYGLNLEDLRYMYFKNDRISYNNRDILVDMLADVEVIESIHKAVRKQVEKSSFPTYFYKFSYADEMSLSRRQLQFPLSGANHFDETEYLFYIKIREQLDLKPIKKGTQMYKIMEQMTEMWTNFATYGSPTPTTSDILPVEWLPVNDARNLRYLNIDKKLQMETITNLDQLFMTFKHNQH